MNVTEDVTVPGVTRQTSNTPTIMNATEDDLVLVPSTSSPTCEEASNQQQKKLKDSTRCELVLHAIRVNKELENSDNLLDNDLPPEEAFYRCPSYGLCIGGKLVVGNQDTGHRLSLEV